LLTLLTRAESLSSAACSEFLPVFAGLLQRDSSSRSPNECGRSGRRTVRCEHQDFPRGPWAPASGLWDLYRNEDTPVQRRPAGRRPPQIQKLADAQCLRCL
jgi:hypothetical protein